MENKKQSKKVSIDKIGIFLIAVLAIAFICFLFCQTNKIGDAQSLVVSAIAAVASIVVIGNFSQVVVIKDEMRKENENVRAEFEKFKENMENKLKGQNDRIDGLKRSVDEAMAALNNDEEMVIEKKDKELINGYLNGEGMADVEIKTKIDVGPLFRYYLAGDKDKKAIIIKAGIGLVGIVDEDFYLNRWDDEEERERERTKLAEFKRKFVLK